ncbi:hypothetical protein C8T65DRAFT_748774 [Cerioporus squamosus]|nr:hypothetical protein C8T65DRAFT_748774 [Cerioporus squamosus]
MSSVWSNSTSLSSEALQVLYRELYLMRHHVEDFAMVLGEHRRPLQYLACRDLHDRLSAIMQTIRMELVYQAEVGEEWLAHAPSQDSSLLPASPLEQSPPSEFDLTESEAPTEDFYSAGAPSPPPPWEDDFWKSDSDIDTSWQPLGLVNIDDEESDWPSPMLLQLDAAISGLVASPEEAAEAQVSAYWREVEDTLPEGITIDMLT